MTRMYRTLRIARIDEDVLRVVIDAPPMNLIGPELVRDLVTLLSELESDAGIRLMVLESADQEYFDADEAERYDWVDRALPGAELDEFVARLARRIASFPADAVRSTKQMLNELTLPSGSSNWSARTRSRPAW